MSKEKRKARWLFFGKDKYTYDTIDELVNKSMGLAVGEVVTLNGYYSADDGATHERVIADTDDGSGVQLRSGLWANIVHNGEVNVSWFGAKGDDITDNLETFKKSIKVANIINIPNGRFILSDSLETNGKTLVGKGSLNTYLIFSNTDGIIINQSKTNIRDFSIFYNEINNTESFAIKCATTKSHTYMNTIKNIIIWNSYIGIGSLEKAIFSSVFENIEIRSFYKNGISFLSEGFGYTGSLFENIYIQNSDNPKKLLENAIHLKNVSDSIFNQINIENISCETFIFIEACKNLSFNGVHFEKAHCLTPNISATSLFRLSQSDININGLTYVFSDIDTTKDINIIYSNKDNYININCIYINNLTEIKKSNTYLFNDENSIEALVNIFSFNNKSTINFLLKGDKSLNNFNSTNSSVKKIKPLNKVNFEECISNYKELGYCDDGFITTSKVSGFPVNSVGHFNHILGDSKMGTLIISTSRSADKNIYIKKKIDDSTWTEWRKIQFIDNIAQLNTPYMATKMQGEGVYDDFIMYMDDKTAYDKEQQQLEKERQAEYQKALEVNPELSYEEWLSQQPALLPYVEEPRPTSALQKFMDKYL